jgi:hypothetical protein
MSRRVVFVTGDRPKSFALDDLSRAIRRALREAGSHG